MPTHASTIRPGNPNGTQESSTLDTGWRHAPTRCILWVQGLPDQAVCDSPRVSHTASTLEYPPPLVVLAYAACPIALWKRRDYGEATSNVQAVTQAVGTLSFGYGPSGDIVRNRWGSRGTRLVLRIQAEHGSLRASANRPNYSDFASGTWTRGMTGTGTIARAEAGVKRAGAMQRSGASRGEILTRWRPERRRSSGVPCSRSPRHRAAAGGPFLGMVTPRVRAIVEREDAACAGACSVGARVRSLQRRVRDPRD